MALILGRQGGILVDYFRIGGIWENCRGSLGTLPFAGPGWHGGLPLCNLPSDSRACKEACQSDRPYLNLGVGGREKIICRFSPGTMVFAAQPGTEACLLCNLPSDGLGMQITVPGRPSFFISCFISEYF